MSNTFKEQVPLVSATQFNVSPQAIDDGAAAYGTAVTAGTGDWVLGSVLKRLGRAMLVVVDTGVLTGAPTALKVALHGAATDANGTSGAEIAATVKEWATPAGDSSYTHVIDMGAITDETKYYSLALASNGAGTTSVIAGATALVLDPVYA
jgi:hypothetical protein